MEGQGVAITGVLFEPFEEVKKESFVVPMSPNVSLARQFFVEECEAALNQQIKSVYCHTCSFSFLMEAY